MEKAIKKKACTNVRVERNTNKAEQTVISLIVRLNFADFKRGLKCAANEIPEPNYAKTN